MTQKAKIYLFPKGHGGRESGFKMSYARLGIVFSSGESQLQFGCEIRSIEGSSIPLDEFIQCEVDVMNRTDVRDYLHVGNGFRIFEGSRLIGVGIWETE